MGGHHPNAEPFSRCYGAGRPGLPPPPSPGSRLQPCTCPQRGMQPVRLTVTPALRLNLCRDFNWFSQGKMFLQHLRSPRGDSRCEWLAPGCGDCVSWAGDEVVVWCTANAGALALLKVAEGINQGRISLSCPWCYLLLWKVSKLWLHNYDSFPQASVSTI